MKVSFKNISKKIALGVSSALVAVSGATAGVFAAIPHSTTGIISACRANSDGTVRLIDTQAGASCNGSETAISWASGDSSHSALLRINPDPENPRNFVMDSARSRNVVNFKVEVDPEDPLSKSACVQLTFNAEMSEVRLAAPGSIGMGPQIAAYLRSDSTSNAEWIDYICGSNYNAIIPFYTSAYVESHVFSFVN